MSTSHMTMPMCVLHGVQGASGTVSHLQDLSCQAAQGILASCESSRTLWRYQSPACSHRKLMGLERVR